MPNRISALVLATIAGAAGVLTGSGAAVGTPHLAATTPTTPVLTVTITKKSLTLSTHSVVAGRIDLKIKAVGGEQEFQIAAFAKGYSFTKLRADEIAVGKDSGPNGVSKAGIKILDHALAKTTYYGGLDAAPGQPVAGSVVLPGAGVYYVWNDDDLPKQPAILTVTGPEVHRAAPTSTATVTGRSDDRFGGPSTLPAKGTITFRDTTSGSMRSPHFWALLHVKPGTTRKAVIEALQSNSRKPSFALKQFVGIDAVNPGMAETVTYALPKGAYVELCFFPDPKTGIPHALMGMVRIVTLH